MISCAGTLVSTDKKTQLVTALLRVYLIRYLLSQNKKKDTKHSIILQILLLFIKLSLREDG